MKGNHQEIKQKVAGVFNLVSSGYDDPSLRHFPLVADYLVSSLHPATGSKVLDIATGTGAFAVAAARAVGEQGRVHAIDLAQDMLNQVQIKADKLKLNNIILHKMDAASLDFKPSCFDAVACSFGIFFIPDMQAALHDWLRVLKPGGQLIFTTFGKPAFKPMAELFRNRLEEIGVPVDKLAWERLADPEDCRSLLEQAGGVDSTVETRQFGFHLNDAESWWSVIWNSGFRGYVEPLDPGTLDRLRTTHLQEISELATDDGIYMDVTVNITKTYRP
jgi:ubiquinone/menaquinone biosynthesis C-methylase UbiE